MTLVMALTVVVNHCESQDYVLICDASYSVALDACSKFMLRYLVLFVEEGACNY